MNITEDKVKAYGLIALGLVAAYAIYKVIKTGEDAAASVSDTLHNVIAFPGKVIDALTPETHIDQNTMARPGDIAHPAQQRVFQPGPMDGNDDAVYDPMTGVQIGLDNGMAGRVMVAKQMTSPNPFMAMSDNGDNQA